MQDNEQYNRLKARTTIDVMLLTEELIEIPQLQQEAAEAVTTATHIRDSVAVELKLAEADESARIRNIDAEAGIKPRSETQLKSEVPLNRDVRRLMMEVANAEADVGMWKSVHDALKTKSKSIDTIADLIRSGYTSPSSITADRKAHSYSATQPPLAGRRRLEIPPRQ